MIIYMKCLRWFRIWENRICVNFWENHRRQRYSRRHRCWYWMKFRWCTKWIWNESNIRWEFWWETTDRTFFEKYFFFMVHGMFVEIWWKICDCVRRFSTNSSCGKVIFIYFLCDVIVEEVPRLDQCVYQEFDVVS